MRDNQSVFKSKLSQKVLCVFCKLPHRVYGKKEVSIFDVFLMFFISGLFAFLIWGTPDLRSLLIFMGLAFTLQTFMRVRWRESVKCPHCGFDPILYKSDAEGAAQKVKAFMEERKDNPQYLLKPRPNIPSITKKRESSLVVQEENLGVEQAPVVPSVDMQL